MTKTRTTWITSALVTCRQRQQWKVTQPNLPSSWWKISASRSLSMLHPNMAIKAPEIITCRSATRLQGNVSAKNGSQNTGRQVNGASARLWSLCKTAWWRWRLFRNFWKCQKISWKMAAKLYRLIFNGCKRWMKSSSGVIIPRVPTCQLRVQANAGGQDCGDTVTDLQTRSTSKKTRHTQAETPTTCVRLPSTLPNQDRWSAEDTWLL